MAPYCTSSQRRAKSTSLAGIRASCPPNLHNGSTRPQGLLDYPVNRFCWAAITLDRSLGGMRHRRQHYRKPAPCYVIALPPVIRRFISTPACLVRMIQRRDSPSTPLRRVPQYCVKRRNRRTANCRRARPNLSTSSERKCPPQAANRRTPEHPQLRRPRTFIKRSKPSSPHLPN